MIWKATTRPLTSTFLLPSHNTHLDMSNSELATSYAALILADDGVDITVCSRAEITT